MSDEPVNIAAAAPARARESGLYWVREIALDGDGEHWTVGENQDGWWYLMGTDHAYSEKELAIGERCTRPRPEVLRVEGIPRGGIDERVTIDDAIAVLNAAVKLDRVAVLQLLTGRVSCTAALATHPSVRCAHLPPDVAESMRTVAPEMVKACALTGYAVGVLGLINGLFGVDEHGSGPISARIELPVVPDGAPRPAPVLLGFERVQ